MCAQFRDMVKNVKEAYTLAEILIVLVIIGTISVMVLPTVNVSVKERKLATAARVERTKIIEAIDSLSAVDRAGNHADTAAFVDALREHLKIIKVCSVDNLTDCWGYDEISMGEGTYSISGATNGESTFGMNGSDHRGRSADYSSSNVGLVLADGTPVVISYNTKCRRDGTEPRNCFAAVFDSNGRSMPNKLGEDVILINAKSFGASNDSVATNASANSSVQPGNSAVGGTVGIAPGASAADIKLPDFNWGNKNSNENEENETCGSTGAKNGDSGDYCDD